MTFQANVAGAAALVGALLILPSARASGAPARRDCSDKQREEGKRRIHMLGTQIAGARSARDLSQAQANIDAIRASPCFESSVEEPRDFRSETIKGLQRWWVRGGELWLRSYVSKDNSIVVAADVPPPLDKETKWATSKFREAEDCTDVAGFEANFTAFSQSVSMLYEPVLERARDAPEVLDSNYLTILRRGQEESQGPIATTEKVCPPRGGWLVVQSQSEGQSRIRLFSLKDGLFVSVTKGTLDESVFATQMAPLKLLKETAWNALISKSITIGRVVTTESTLPKGTRRELTEEEISLLSNYGHSMLMQSAGLDAPSIRWGIIWGNEVVLRGEGHPIANPTRNTYYGLLLRLLIDQSESAPKGPPVLVPKPVLKAALGRL